MNGFQRTGRRLEERAVLGFLLHCGSSSQNLNISQEVKLVPKGFRDLHGWFPMQENIGGTEAKSLNRPRNEGVEGADNCLPTFSGVTFWPRQ